MILQKDFDSEDDKSPENVAPAAGIPQGTDKVPMLLKSLLSEVPER